MVLLSTLTADATVAPIDTPCNTGEADADDEVNWMLLAVVVLPITLPLTGVIAVALFTRMPLKVDAAGVLPEFVISIPPTLFAWTKPPVLLALIPVTDEVLVADVVVVVMTMVLLADVEPMMFPSPPPEPPIEMPEPPVSIPTKATELAVVGA